MEDGRRETGDGRLLVTLSCARARAREGERGSEREREREREGEREIEIERSRVTVTSGPSPKGGFAARTPRPGLLVSACLGCWRSGDTDSARHIPLENCLQVPHS